jgi:hypothetical protein
LVQRVVEGAYSHLIANVVSALHEPWALAAVAKCTAMLQLSTMVRAMYPALMLCRLT